MRSSTRSATSVGTSVGVTQGPGKVGAETGHIAAHGPRFPVGSLSNLKDASAIREQLDRVQRAAVDDPALAIGSAKELIESTAKSRIG
jgi:hypothetical protein